MRDEGSHMAINAILLGEVGYVAADTSLKLRPTVKGQHIRSRGEFAKAWRLLVNEFGNRRCPQISTRCASHLCQHLRALARPGRPGEHFDGYHQSHRILKIAA